jgi:hypothetical protein
MKHAKTRQPTEEELQAFALTIGRFIRWHRQRRNMSLEAFTRYHKRLTPKRVVAIETATTARHREITIDELFAFAKALRFQPFQLMKRAEKNAGL